MDSCGGMEWNSASRVLGSSPVVLARPVLGAAPVLRMATAPWHRGGVSPHGSVMVAAAGRRALVVAASAQKRQGAQALSAKKKEETKAWHRFAGSAVGALVAETTSLPTDVAKTRMQVLHHYNGFVDCVRRTVQEEGVTAMWKGLSPALLRQGCYTCLALVIYEPIRNLMTPAGKDPNFVERLAAGGTAGAVSITIFNPTEVIKTQMQSSPTKTTMARVFSQVWHRDGVRGFWAGLPPNVARTFLVNAAELGTYDQAKHWLMQYLGDTFGAFLGASAIAGLTSSVVSTPVDVAKTRLMNQAGGERLYKGLADVFVKTVRNEGPLALYKGFTPIFVRKLIWCSAFFLCYEEIIHALEARDSDI